MRKANLIDVSPFRMPPAAFLLDTPLSGASIGEAVTCSAFQGQFRRAAAYCGRRRERGEGASIRGMPLCLGCGDLEADAFAGHFPLERGEGWQNVAHQTHHAAGCAKSLSARSEIILLIIADKLFHCSNMAQLERIRSLMIWALTFAVAGGAARYAFKYMIETRYVVALFWLLAFLLEFVVRPATGARRDYHAFVINCAAASAAIISVKWIMEGLPPWLR